MDEADDLLIREGCENGARWPYNEVASPSKLGEVGEELLCVASLIVSRRCSNSCQFVNMVRFTSAGLLGSAMVGMTSAAGAGSKAEYESGAVHHRIMEIKMVRSSQLCAFL